MLNDLWLRLRALFRRKTVESELDDELRFHLESQIEKYVQSGMTREEAKRRAQIELGGVEQVKEQCRDVRGIGFLEDTWRDVCYGTRMLRKSPGFTTVAVLTLALGIGANTAIFSLIDALVLRPLPVSNPGELVELWTVVPSHPQGLFSYPLAREIVDESKSFSSAAPWNSALVPLATGGQTAPGSVLLVTSEFFQTLGVHALIGRLFRPGDFKAGPGTYGTSAVISYGFWESRFGGNRDALGKTAEVNGHPYTIVGVAAKNFQGPIVGMPIDAWVPLAPPLAYAGIFSSNRIDDSLFTARLRPGVTLAEARAEIETLWPSILRRNVPVRANADQERSFLHQGISIEPASAGFPNTSLLEFERPLWVLMAGVGLVLLIACANLAGLLVARAASRQREMGIRVALGATRARLARQVLTEGAMLSFAGALVALPCAYLAAKLLVGLISVGPVPLVLNPNPDWRILLFTGGLACATSGLFSLLPAWQAGHRKPASFMQEQARASGRSSAGRQAGRLLVAGQVGLSLVLVAGASLFSRSLASLHSIDLGFNTDKVLGLWLQPKAGAHMDGLPYYHSLIDELARIAGVRSVSLSGGQPIMAVKFKFTEPVSRDLGGGLAASSVAADEHVVSPNFFATLGMRVLQGRDFAFSDDTHSEPVAIISQSLAKRLFPESEAIGQSITVATQTGTRARRIVGVVGDANFFYVQNQKPMAVYLPFFQQTGPVLPFIEVKTYGEPTSVAAAARRLVDTSGLEYVLLSETLRHEVSNSLVNERALALLSDVFGGLAMLLVAIGLYGLVSYSVAGRTSEIGVRMALGAEPGRVLRMVFSDSLRLITIGVLVGMPVVFVTSKLITGLLFNLSPTDPVSLIVAIVIVVVVALLATYVPARRAMRINPVEALRHE